MSQLIRFSNIDKLDVYIKNKLEFIEQKGFELLNSKNINYGTQLRFKKNGLTYLITLYYSEKRGISLVKTQGCNDLQYDELLSSFEQESLQTKNKDDIDSLTFKSYIGTDEAGKGDYYGPLVVAGFVFDKKSAELYKSIGIKDSKLIKDTEVIRIYDELTKLSGEKLFIHKLMPEIYNKKINEYKRNNMTLNDLLGEAHAYVIETLSCRFGNIEAIITDQFTHQDKVYKHIKGKVNAKYIQKVRAESNDAVAAASIAARAVFLNSLEEMGYIYDCKFPKGASNGIVEFGLEFCRKYSFDELRKVAKLHFKTTNAIEEKLQNEGAKF